MSISSYRTLGTILMLFLLARPLSALNLEEARDTTLSTHLLEEVVVNPKASSKLFEFPGAVTQLTGLRMEEMHLQSLKEVSALIPNVYIPDYGARLTSAIYIRGIGSRINSPAVGLSVDNVPYMDKSSFDFDLLNIQKIEFLRGPQGTLYGRNTMAGLINVYTYSPFEKEQTQLKVGYGNYNTREVAALLSRRLSSKWALSVSGQYRGGDGYFRNVAKEEKADPFTIASGRGRLLYKPTTRLTFDFNLAYEYSQQEGYPYFRYDKTTQNSSEIAYNDDCGYRRNMVNSSLGVQYVHDRFLLSATTGYQYFNDQMDLDQDFTPRSIFTLQQKQKQNALTQEIVFRSTTQKRLQFVAGVFGFYQGLQTQAPVTFKEEGMALLIPATAPILDKTLYIPGNYDTPAYGAALFKQLSYNDLFVKGLTATIGLRLNYEGTQLTHNTQTTVTIQAGAMPFPVPYTVGVNGREELNSWELLPKFELKYKACSAFFAYASVAKGYRSGGFNIQMFSDVLQAKLRNMGSAMGGGGSAQAAGDLKDLIVYKPERSWNYEVGMRGDLFDKQLTFDAALFYIDCQDQQISEFAENGYGRITRNTGRTGSWGGELTLRALPVKGLHLAASYGYTHATFRHYVVKEEDVTLNYKGNYVPFAPQHSFNLSADYTWYLSAGSFLDAIRLGARYSGKGRIYWTEENDVSQPFYGLLSSELEFRKGGVSLLLWGKNLTETRYHTFYFETLNAENTATKNGFAERGRPLTCGATVKVAF